MRPTTLLTLLAATVSSVSVSALSSAELIGWSAGVVSNRVGRTAVGGGAHTMDDWHYEDCGLPSDIVQLKSLKVSPDPPVPGQNLTVTVEAEVLETIDDGAYADVVVKLGLIKLIQKRFDICEEAVNANATVQCPVTPGPYTVEQTVELPKEIPKAKFSVGVRGFNLDDKDMLCLNIWIDFMKGKV